MSFLPWNYSILAIIGLSILLVWSLIKMVGQIKKKQSPKIKHSIPFFASLIVMLWFIKVQHNFFYIIVAIISTGVSVLIGSIVSIVKQSKNNETIKISHFIGPFISLTLLEAIYCFYLAMKMGLGHRNITFDSELPIQCLLSSILIVVLPIGGLVIYKYTRSRRKTWVYFIIYFLIFALSSIYTAPGASALLVDEKGKPVTNAYVFYHRYYHFLFSNWGSFQFIRTDSDGRFSVPMFINICLPFEYSFGLIRPFVDS